VREVAEFLAELKELGAERVRVSEVRERVANRLRGCLESDPWRRLLTDELGACIEAYDAEAIPAQLLVRRLYEVVADQRRTQSIGFGVHLATIHSAKGREFPHVFLLPRDLRRDEQDPESERRLLYVGMTRAEQTLTVVVTKDIRNPFVDHLASSSAVERVPWVTQTERPTIEFRVLGLRDMNLGYAGNTTTSGVAEGLRKLRYGSEVELVPGERSGTLGVRAVGSGPVLAWLAKNAAADLLPRLDTVRSAKVLAVVRWSAERSGEDYRERLRRDVWEVPVLEVRLGRRG
jgi:ATP-dependent DNA helicase RecQ